MTRSLFLALALGAIAHAHVAVWHPGMYCRGGPDPNVDDSNTNTAVNPLYQLSKQDWWFQHYSGCDAVPPAAGDFLEFPAGGSVTVEMANNRAFSTLSYGGSHVSDWPDGGNHPEDWHAPNATTCLEDGGGFMHTKNQTNAAGTAFAISYTPNLNEVTMENLVVFSVLEHTPWKRLSTYQVPSNLPACPDEGCTCAWLWVPDGCGQPNMYMQGFKCKVTGATSTTPLPAAKAPVWCADDQSKCVKGPKQMIAWQQAEGNNVVAPDGQSPAYNMKLGFANGAQTDLFSS